VYVVHNIHTYSSSVPKKGMSVVVVVVKGGY
jgi:hypothetical protein